MCLLHNAIILNESEKGIGNLTNYVYPDIDQLYVYRYAVHGFQ